MGPAILGILVLILILGWVWYEILKDMYKIIDLWKLDWLPSWISKDTYKSICKFLGAIILIATFLFIVAGWVVMAYEHTKNKED